MKCRGKSNQDQGVRRLNIKSPQQHAHNLASPSSPEPGGSPADAAGAASGSVGGEGRTNSGTLSGTLGVTDSFCSFSPLSTFWISSRLRTSYSRSALAKISSSLRCSVRSLVARCRPSSMILFTSSSIFCKVALEMYLLGLVRSMFPRTSDMPHSATMW